MAMGLSSDRGRFVTRGSFDGEVPLLPFWIRSGGTWMVVSVSLGAQEKDVGVNNRKGTHFGCHGCWNLDNGFVFAAGLSSDHE